MWPTTDASGATCPSTSWRTVHSIFTRWWQDGDLYALHNDLREQVRIADGREPEPSAGIIDAQSPRAAETVAAGSRGYDVAKKVQGTERHLIVDTLGLLLVAIVTAASAQDRDGAKPALERLRDWYERITLVWADSAYAGKLVTWAKKHVRLTLEIVKRSDDASSFVVLPRRWMESRPREGRPVRAPCRLEASGAFSSLEAWARTVGARSARDTSTACAGAIRLSAR